MELNTNKVTLSFSKGMTNVPSDFLSEDNELVESKNIIYRDGEMKPIQKPVIVGAVAADQKMMFVHKMSDYENIITYDESSAIYWYKRNSDGSISNKCTGFNVGNVYDINAVGNTLIVATNKGLHYFLWKNNAYKDLGTELPTPEFQPWFTLDNKLLTGRTPAQLYGCTSCNKTDYKVTVSNGKPTIYKAENGFDYYKISLPYDDDGEYVAKIKTFHESMQGHVAEAINVAKENNKFVGSFFVRFALKLFDGSYARISNPIACYPIIRRNGVVRGIHWVNNDDYTWDYIVRSGRHDYWGTFMFQNYYADMLYIARINNISDWTDIVKELVIFASDDVMPFDIEQEYKLVDVDEMYGQTRFDTYGNAIYSSDTVKFGWQSSATDYQIQADNTMIAPSKYKSDVEIRDELLTKTQFYKLFSIKATDSDKLNWSSHKASDIMPSKVVANLTVQEQLKVDDYYGWTTLLAKKTYSYNNRLNIFNIARYPWKGFNLFSAETNSSYKYQFKFYVHIESNLMSTWVESDTRYMGEDAVHGWFYYPDPNATEVVIYSVGQKTGMKLKLSTHPYLNGSYCFVDLPGVSSYTNTLGSISLPSVDETAHETLDSQVYTSVVNNPYVFEASGDNTIGTGKIIGIIANVEPISQGQFGQYPLFVFTEEGIYAMAVNSEGLYSSIYPMSREICNNADSLTATDRLIFFTSQKGLMAVSGGTVTPASELLRGRKARNFSEYEMSFLDFLENCKIAYDYRDSMLRIFNPDKTYQYVYSIANKTFAIVDNSLDCKAIVNDFPDNLIQTSNGDVYSLINKPEVNEDENTYDGRFVTRPLKLGSNLVLKTIRDIKHFVDTNEGKIAIKLYGSNDCKNWCELKSLKGKPWRYFTVEFSFSGFKAIDTIAASVVAFHSRRELI